MEKSYKDISLRKLKIIPVSQELVSDSHTSDDYQAYGYETNYMGRFYNLEEAKKALDKHIETESEVIAYEIIGPEHGYGEPVLDIDWDNVSNDEEEDVFSDESPEFYFLFDKKKNLISSYFYDKDNPGGNRSEGEIIFNKGDIAYVRDSIYIGENQYYLLIPVQIEGKVTKEYLGKKWKNAIKESYKQLYGEDFRELSEDQVNQKIDSLLNIEKDSLIFKPLVTVKCNWREEPNYPMDDSPRIDFLPITLIKKTMTIAEKLYENLGSKVTYRSKGGVPLFFPKNYISKMFEDLFNIGPAEKEKFEEAFDIVTSGQGKEIQKINSVHSSSLLSLLFFYPLYQNGDPELFIQFEGLPELKNIKFTSCLFEVRNSVIKFPSCVDVLLVSDDGNTLFYLESKLSEYKDKSYREEYGKGYYPLYKQLQNQHLLETIMLEEGNKDKTILKCGEKSYIEGIKQSISHLIGLVKGPEELKSEKKDDYYYIEEYDKYSELYEKASSLLYGTILYNPSVLCLNDNDCSDYKDFEDYKNLYQHRPKLQHLRNRGE